MDVRFDLSAGRPLEGIQKRPRNYRKRASQETRSPFSHTADNAGKLWLRGFGYMGGKFGALWTPRSMKSGDSSILNCCLT